MLGSKGGSNGPKNSSVSTDPHKHRYGVDKHYMDVAVEKGGMGMCPLTIKVPIALGQKLEMKFPGFCNEIGL